MRSANAALALLLLAGAARADDAPDAKNELAAAIALLKAHHMNREKADWSAVEAQAQAMLGDKIAASDAYPTIRFVIRQLNEKHTHLITADTVKAIATGKAVGDARTPDNPTPEGYVLAGGIGLVSLKQHQGTAAEDVAYANAARAALGQFAQNHVCRYIVDLRGNTGGNMLPMIDGVDALLGPQPYGYWQEVNALEQAWVLPDIAGAQKTMADQHRDSAPVAILIDRNTASAGEDTAIAFEGRERTRIFGEPSAGFLTANRAYPLPDGALLAVSMGWIADRRHRAWRDTITPDEPTPRGQATVDAAIAWLKQQTCTP